MARRFLGTACLLGVSCHLIAGLDKPVVQQAEGGSSSAGDGGTGGSAPGLSASESEHYGDAAAQRLVDITLFGNKDAAWAGIFTGEIFEPPYSSRYPAALFVHKVDGKGASIWGRSVEGEFQRPRITSNSGRVMVATVGTGPFVLFAPIGFDNSALNSPSAGFVAEFGVLDGTTHWAKRLTNVGQTIHIAAVDCSEQTFMVAGSFLGSLNIDSFGFVNSETAPDGFVATLETSNGVAKWVTQIHESGTGTREQLVTAGGMDGSENVYVAGVFAGNNVVLDSGGCTLTGGTNERLFLAKYHAAGAAEICLPIAATAGASITAADVSSDGHFVIAGEFGNADGGSLELSSNIISAGPALFVALYDSTLKNEWAHAYGPRAEGTRIEDVAFDADGNIVLVGSLAETITLDGVVLQATGGEDAFMVILDAIDGRRLASSVFGDGGTATASGVAAFGETIAIAGHFTGSIDFGPGPMSTRGSQPDVFVAWFE